MVICLNSLATSNNLYLHASRPPKTDPLKKFYEVLKSETSRLGVPFELSHSKINISDPTIYWEHENFSRKKKRKFSAVGWFRDPHFR